MIHINKHQVNHVDTARCLRFTKQIFTCPYCGIWKDKIKLVADLDPDDRPLKGWQMREKK